MHSACVTLCLCVRALSCISCGKACSSAQNCAALWKLCTSRYRRLQMLRGQAQVPLAMLPRSSSVNQHCLPRASPARREESLREGTSQGLLLCNTPKNRVAALLPRTVSRTTRVEAGPPPPPPAWPARNLLLETQRRRREKDTSLGRLVKRVSRSKLLRWRCWPSKSVVSRRIVRSDIIPFDSRPRIARANREN